MNPGLTSCDSKNSPTSLSSSRAVVCGGLHSTLCFWQSSAKAWRASSLFRSWGILVSRASSKPLQHTHEHQRPDIKDRFLKQCTDSRSLVLGVLLKSPAGYSANLSVQRNGTKCMVHISAKARRALWLVRPWDILVLSASCRPLQDTGKGIRHCAEHQRATMHATSWFSKAQHSWDPAGGAARA